MHPDIGVKTMGKSNASLFLKAACGSVLFFYYTAQSSWFVSDKRQLADLFIISIVPTVQHNFYNIKIFSRINVPLIYTNVWRFSTNV